MTKAISRRAVPVVFISSIHEDLKQYRAEARDAAIQAGFYLASLMCRQNRAFLTNFPVRKVDNRAGRIHASTRASR